MRGYVGMERLGDNGVKGDATQGLKQVDTQKKRVWEQVGISLITRQMSHNPELPKSNS